MRCFYLENIDAIIDNKNINIFGKLLEKMGTQSITKQSNYIMNIKDIKQNI